jgi:hypothetical protein
MLENIIDSKADSSVLGFFAVVPERAFSAVEVSRRLGIGRDKTTAILKKFAGQGVISAFTKKGKRYYIVNGRHALLPEVRAYFAKNGPHYEDELFLAIRRLGEIKAAFLSGIFTAQPNLPVDLLLVGKVNLKKLTEFMKHLEKLMGQEINYSIMTVDEFEIRRHTFDRFIKDIFDYRHVVVFDQVTKK